MCARTGGSDAKRREPLPSPAPPSRVRARECRRTGNLCVCLGLEGKLCVCFDLDLV